MRASLPFATLLLFAALGLLIPTTTSAQAMCVDESGTMCLDHLRAAREDGVVADIFRTSDGRLAPQLTFATLVRGINGCIGVTHTPTILTGYTCGAPGTNPPGGNDPAFHANSLDWYWTQILRTRADGSTVAEGEAGSYAPSRGRIYDLGGEANRVVLFPITDHGPLPCEAFEYTVWLSNNPDATEIAPVDAPDPMMWNPAQMIRAFTEGWTHNPTAVGAADADRADLEAHLADNSAGEAIADSISTVWALPCGLTFRYAAIQAGNEGNPDAVCAFHSSEDELDAVAGLNEDDTVICVDADRDGHRDIACGGTDCDDTDPAVHPGAFERCDEERNLDCEENVECAEGTVCDASTGLCAVACFEFGCAAGFTCVMDQCIESACAERDTPCAEGTRCRGGECVAPCDGVVCPDGEMCVGGACLDPCAGVECPTNQVCIAGTPGATTVCGPACTCTEITSALCPDDTACDARDSSDAVGLCVDPGCETTTCAASETCRGGACVDACEGVRCPIDQICQAGHCDPDPCARLTCDAGDVCRAGMCVDACDGVMCDDGQICQAGSCVADPCAGIMCNMDETCVAGRCIGGAADAGSGSDSGLGSDAGTSDAGDGEEPMTDGGCGCRVGGTSPSPLPLMMGILIWGLVVRRRWR